MVELEYKGETYKRYNGQWVDENYILVTIPMQKELNKLYIKTIDIESLSVEQLIKEGDHFKGNEDYELAIKYYEEASKSCDKETLSYILPRISSCYRKNLTPRKAIEFFSFSKAKFGADIMSPALLTSAAAAYCDLGEYENALKCANVAYAKSNGADANLKSVLYRIKKEMGDV